MSDLRDKDPGIGEQVGEGIGGITGTLTGAAIGSLAGPLGTILGSLAGALGGWWAGEKAGRGLEDTAEHDEHYRIHYEQHPAGDLDYEEVHPAYAVGHAAGGNPDYAGWSWERVDEELERSWSYGAYPYTLAHRYVAEGFRHRRSHGP